MGTHYFFHREDFKMTKMTNIPHKSDQKSIFGRVFFHGEGIQPSPNPLFLLIVLLLVSKDYRTHGNPLFFPQGRLKNDKNGKKWTLSEKF